MKLFIISQDTNTDYDTYDSAVVCADNEEEAKKITPAEAFPGTWCADINDVKVEYIGEAKEGTKKGVILSSFNAG